MPCWYYEKTRELRNTPSIQDGIEYDTECRYRREGARFIIDTGSKMDLGYNTVATGVVFFHRFYMFHSFRNFPRYVTACCCLFLAGKVEETPKKCKDIIKIAQTLLTKQEFMTFGKDPKEEVVTLERILLQTIKFDLQVEHPYSYLLTYAKCLKGDKIKLQEMVQRAWNFVNDSLCTTLSLQWEPEIIAIALMYLAGKLSKFEVKDWNGRQLQHLRWWDMFVEDVRMDLLEDICHQMLDHYSQADNARPPDSPPLVMSSEVNRDRIVTPPITETATAAPNGSCLSSNGQPALPPQTDSAHACLDQWVGLDRPSTNPWSLCRNGLWRNVAAVTPSKVPKVEPVVIPANGCAPAEPIDPIRPLDIPSHFTLYPTGYTPTPMGFPPVFPLTNISVPPPPVTINHHIVSAMRHLGSAGTIRPSPLNPAPGQPFPPYGYRPNATYFSSANPVPPTNVQRPYYPPQP